MSNIEDEIIVFSSHRLVTSEAINWFSARVTFTKPAFISEKNFNVIEEANFRFLEERCCVAFKCIAGKPCRHHPPRYRRYAEDARRGNESLEVDSAAPPFTANRIAIARSVAAKCASGWNMCGKCGRGIWMEIPLIILVVADGDSNTYVPWNCICLGHEESLNLLVHFFMTFTMVVQMPCEKIVSSVEVKKAYKKFAVSTRFSKREAQIYASLYLREYMHLGFFDFIRGLQPNLRRVRFERGDILNSTYDKDWYVHVPRKVSW